jgi:hypothetical protein
MFCVVLILRLCTSYLPGNTMAKIERCSHRRHVQPIYPLLKCVDVSDCSLNAELRFIPMSVHSAIGLYT